MGKDTDTAELPKPSWQAIAKARKEELDASIPKKWRLKHVPSVEEEPNVINKCRGLLDEEARAITEKSFADLSSDIRAGQLSAVQVTKAFLQRSAYAHQLVNCLTDYLYDDAISQAKQLDEHFTKHKEVVGPLHGIPVSLKEQIRLRGTRSSVGFVAWLSNVETPETESEIVKILRSAGAVFHVKTNVPTSLMAIETNNNIYGYTENPYNRALSSGGSSGGEGALVALRGSLLGVGSDIGASIRLPANFNGVFGLKPSHGRFPLYGVRQSFDGQNVVRSVLGPLGADLDAIEAFCSVTSAGKPWLRDPQTLPLPWKTDIDQTLADSGKKHYKFGLLLSDGVVEPHPPIKAALERTAELLRAHGHEVVEWVPPSHADAFKIMWDVFAQDGGDEIHDTCAESGEPLVPEVSVSYGTSKGTLKKFTLDEVWGLQRRKDEYGARYASYWNDTGVDGVILPAAPSVAWKKGTGAYFGYTATFNALDYPACAIPTGLLDDSLVQPASERKEFHGDIDKLVWSHYDEEAAKGSPIGVQVVGRKLMEEKVVSMSRAVVDAVQTANA